MIEFENLGAALSALGNELRNVNLVAEAAKDAEGVLKQRIFNQGKAAGGSMLGKYKSKQWKETRKQHGRQVAYRDFEFSGDLRDSITVGTRGGDEATIEIVGKEQLDKANNLTRIAGKDVFVLDKAEADAVMDRAAKYMDKKIDELFNKYL